MAFLYLPVCMMSVSSDWNRFFVIRKRTCASNTRDLLEIVCFAGVDAFKEIARLATHTILAACGLEHRKSGVHFFPRSVCSHMEHTQQLHKSTLMPNSCRECFCTFVKDVVESIMFEKVGCVKSS